MFSILRQGSLHCIVAVLLPALPVAASVPDVIDAIRPGVVGVGSVQPGKVPGKEPPSVNFLGTGFVVADGSLIVTNFHVVSHILDANASPGLSIFRRLENNIKAHTVKLIASDPEHDLALLKLADIRLEPLQVGQSGAVREGTQVLFTGFPIGMVLGLRPVTHRGIVSAITPIVIPATSSSALTAAQIRRKRAPFSVFQLDATAYPGNSGSPVYLADTGLVIGILNSVFVKETRETMLERPSGITYAIPARYLDDMLRGLDANRD